MTTRLFGKSNAGVGTVGLLAVMLAIRSCFIKNDKDRPVYT